MEENIQKLAMYLRILYETFKDSYVEMSLAKDATDCAIPYATTLSSILTKKGILSAKHINGNRRNSLSYKWISKTEPNLVMAKAIINECRSACRSTYYQTHDKCDEIAKDETKVTIPNYRPPSIQIFYHQQTNPIDQLKEMIGKAYYGVRVYTDHTGESSDMIQKGILQSISITENHTLFHLDTMSNCLIIAKSLTELEKILDEKTTNSQSHE